MANMDFQYIMYDTTFAEDVNKKNLLHMNVI